MPFINGYIGANWRVELRGGPLGCKRERARQRQREREGERGREGWGGREFSEGLTARPLQLLHYWSSAKGERGQCLRKEEHTERQRRTSVQARQCGCIDNLQPSGFDEVRSFFFFSSLLWFPPRALCEENVCGANLCQNGGGPGTWVFNEHDYLPHISKFIQGE